MAACATIELQIVLWGGRPAAVVPDSIERELILPAPPERVWTALTQPAQLGAWWGTQATIDLRPGGEVSFVWDGTDGQRFTSRGIVEVVEPPHRLVFRWQSEPTVEATTRVEFTLQPHPQGTRLRVVESGFSTLPPGWRGPLHERNDRGWPRALGQLADYLAGR